MLTWTLSPKNHLCKLRSPLVQKEFKSKSESLFNFAKNYGYFSVHHPIVGIVTSPEKDIEVTQCLLTAIQSEIGNAEQLSFASDEILSKVMAYRTLAKGQRIKVPVSKSEMVTYVVDEVIDLWLGMPAFGLVPENSKQPPILLFRGTDLDLVSEKGWASILSDLDTTGTGHKTFLRAKDEIHAWLTKMNQSYGPSRVVGFSLGGAFVFYTLIYESELVNKELPSVAFNPPGISEQVLEKWEALPLAQKTPLNTYINQCDLVSQIGFFLGNVKEVTLDEPMEVIEAHVLLICAEPMYKLSDVDLLRENQRRKNQ